MASYRQLEQLFVEETSLLGKWVAVANDEVFKLDLKLNDINELAKDKSMEELFSFIKSQPKIQKINEALVRTANSEETVTSFNK
jgi:hypothetical protein